MYGSCSRRSRYCFSVIVQLVNVYHIFSSFVCLFIFLLFVCLEINPGEKLLGPFLCSEDGTHCKAGSIDLVPLTPWNQTGYLHSVLDYQQCHGNSGTN